ncbi:hypothetical protein EDC01DRAFT_658563 [Geopyxis carbonaria]|nr:hypothetical protein EDC01DRAFT_658563 [Geopyxis carbonaria]
MATKQPTSAPVAGPLTTSRRQPLRQARQARKPAGGRVTNGIGGSNDQSSSLAPTKFYPALTAFTDALDALPAETIRHFTLLREVDAKACIPEANLRALIDAAERLAPAEDPNAPDAAFEALRQLEELRRGREDPVFAASHQEALAELDKHELLEATTPGGARTILGVPESRRARAAQIRGQLSDLLMTEDEKIHVVTTANEALQKHLARIEHAFAYVEVEIPSIYRLGNKEHWAYKEPMKKGAAAAQARERERREAEERYYAMNHAREQESNVRGDSRRTTKNSHAHHHLEDDHETGKKSRSRKDNEPLASTKRLAEQAAGAAMSNTQSQKRRKTAVVKDSEKEKAVKGTASPRAGTPATGANKKKTAVPNVAQRGNRSRNAPTPSATNSPRIPTASPTINGPGTFTVPHPPPLPPPPPPPPLPPQTSTPIHPTSEPTSAPAVPKPTKKAKEAQQQAASAPPDSRPPATPDAPRAPTPKVIRAATPAPPLPPPPAPTPITKKEPEPEVREPPPPPPPKLSHKKKAAPVRVPSPPTPSETAKITAPTPTIPASPIKTERPRPPPITTSSTGSAKTPGGPPSAHTPLSSKSASHRKRSGSTSTVKKTQTKPHKKAAAANAEPEEETYCTCNGISYGEMVACDGEDCKREWFHLDCVGLAQAPRGKAKWYCNDCRGDLAKRRGRAAV